MFAHWLIVLCFQFILHSQAKWVRDVDSSIIDEIHRNPSNAYLIKFYAPWCGHCRKFENTYEEIAKEVYDLSNSVEEFQNLQVARLDATVHTDVASHYDIRGFPTIIFIRNSQTVTFEHERTKSAVLEFLRRVNGASLRWISSIDQFEKARHEHDVFFLLVTSSDENETSDTLRTTYEDLSSKYASQAYFYATNNSALHEKYFSQYMTDARSQVFVIKMEGFYLYETNENHQNLEEFILKENVASFPQVLAGNIRDLIMTKKILIIYAFDDQIKDEREKQKRDKLKLQIQNFIVKHNVDSRKTHQFAWSNDLDLLSHIAVWTFDEPLFFLYDTNRHKYGVYPLGSLVESEQSVDSTLNHLLAHSSEIIRYTGDAWWKRSLRPFWELYRTIISMFKEAPMVSMFVIGLPASVLSIFCYCLCCLPNEGSVDEGQSFPEEIPDFDDSDDELSNDGEKSLIIKKND